jgi:predicted  nucleic acid-binding Zn-ribbon protein
LNVIDFYVELLNDEEADKILKSFKETVPGFSKQSPKLLQKKMHIKKIFKKQTPKTKGASNDPFYFHLSNYDVDKFKGLTTKELWWTLHEISEGYAASHNKFAIALLCAPEVVEERLEGLVTRHREGKPIFETDFSDATLDEIKEYIRKTYRYTMPDDRIDMMLLNIKKIFSTSDIKQIHELAKNIEKMDLLELTKERNRLKEKYPNYIINISYALSHKEEDREILLGFLINALYEYIEKQGKELEDFSDSKLDVSVANTLNEELSEEVDTLRSKLAEAEKEINELKKRNGLVEDEKQKVVQGLTGEIETLKQKHNIEIAELEKNYRKKEEQRSKENEDLKKQINELNETINSFQQLFPAESMQSTSPIVIIYSLETDIVKKIYPELEIYHWSEWRKIKDSGTLRGVAIQRDGTPNSVVTEIVEYAEEKGIRYELFWAGGIKELIDNIGYFKIIFGR